MFYEWCFLGVSLFFNSFFLSFTSVSTGKIENGDKSENQFYKVIEE